MGPIVMHFLLRFLTK